MLTMTERTRLTAQAALDQALRPPAIGQTPHEVIFRQNKAAVRYFAPRHPEGLRRAPVFISMPLINQWQIWDLLPGHSLVEDLTAAGVPVYLLDWGRPGPEDSTLSLGHLVDVLLHRSMDRARRHAGGGELDAIGYCVGGTFLAVYLGRHPAGVRRAAFCCTPIDFHASGRLAVWASPQNFPVDTAIAGFGNYPGRIIRDAFSWLRPEGQTRKWVGLWERAEDPGFRALWAAMERWNSEAVDFPGEAYREYVRRCYFENALIKPKDAPSTWLLDGEPVDLSRATMPALSLAADRDHIVPPPSAHALEQVWGGPVQTRTVRGGHVAPSANGVFSGALLDWIRA